ncbi:hypothetical protein CHGG_03011 [Chaetomium globosum CBS 148.51]|uniref:Uncharacterized protein n=1 Tax=Chaetomium globosum (strain ATCC 6205 / CBS 148.51 / DSM 1962 / NBRC 6347 / NRRL 1970) TaxID=306901 RepID=Q2H9U3_CHAGB|nr:uncharacterized protein CHGG_03011 [Chaetomium globosum CBS 148.51]EAQ91076.1 hypothetical protein CHGG_03011 [Chaetomium globosum CBS 148.51]
MASQNPTTPVKVPSSAASYTAATLDPDLRSQINSLLIKDGHVTKIQESLLHALHSHKSNWPTAVQNHALSLLRSGEVTSFPALLRRVLEDVRQDTTFSPNGTAATATNGTSSSKAAANGTSSEENGTPVANGSGSKTNGAAAAANNGTGAGGRPSLAVPSTVVDEALKVTRDCLDSVCEMDESGAT